MLQVQGTNPPFCVGCMVNQQDRRGFGYCFLFQLCFAFVVNPEQAVPPYKIAATSAMELQELALQRYELEGEYLSHRTGSTAELYPTCLSLTAVSCLACMSWSTSSPTLLAPPQLSPACKGFKPEQLRVEHNQGAAVSVFE